MATASIELVWTQHHRVSGEPQCPQYPRELALVPRSSQRPYDRNVHDIVSSGCRRDRRDTLHCCRPRPSAEGQQRVGIASSRLLDAAVHARSRHGRRLPSLNDHRHRTRFSSPWPANVKFKVDLPFAEKAAKVSFRQPACFSLPGSWQQNWQQNSCRCPGQVGGHCTTSEPLRHRTGQARRCGSPTTTAPRPPACRRGAGAIAGRHQASLASGWALG